MTPDEREAAREKALGTAIRLSEYHDKIEARLLELEIFDLQTGLKEDEIVERQELWTVHDALERDVIKAYAVLHCIDPEVVRRLRDGEEL